MSGFEITCANKDQRGVIIRIGGEGWSFDAREAVVKIITQQLRFYIRLDDQTCDVGVRGEAFDSYLALEPDGFPLHNVTTLPSC